MTGINASMTDAGALALIRVVVVHQRQQNEANVQHVRETVRSDGRKTVVQTESEVGNFCRKLTENLSCARHAPRLSRYGMWSVGERAKRNQLDVTFCILYFSSNSCSICFGATMCPSSGADDCVKL